LVRLFHALSPLDRGPGNPGGLSIGAATFVMSTGGTMTGRLIGMRFGRWGEIIGGAALFALGLSILVDHLTS
jgi:manganese efflux pump family protein